MDLNWCGIYADCTCKATVFVGGYIGRTHVVNIHWSMCTGIAMYVYLSIAEEETHLKAC